MIKTLITLIKFNLIMLLLAVLNVFVIYGGREVGVVGVLLGLYAIYKNIRIIWEGRYRIVASVESAALNATASAIEFRQKADARVIDRARSRSLEK